jgi:hypothetical protein
LTSTLKNSSLGTWISKKRQKAKEKEDLERSREPPMLRMITFIFTLVAMGLGMSTLPIFPSPMPIFLAVLVAFVVYNKPQVGMPIGGLLIGLGLLFHLSQEPIYFIAYLGDTSVRIAFIVVWMALFVVVPAISKRYKSALAIDFGILAVMVLFSAPAYFLAIPILLASAVYFKKYVTFSVIYYVLISVPLQIFQYFNYIKDIVRVEWWLEPGSSPPLFVSLSSIAKDLTTSMSQFRLYDLSNVFTNIAGQTTWVPDIQGRTLADAMIQYRDSIPGLLMFVIIVVGLAVTFLFFSSTLVKSGYIGSGDKLFPCFTATLAAALFFMLLSTLQKPLAFTADVGIVAMIVGPLATLVFTLPVVFLEYNPKQRTTSQEVTDKAKALMDRLKLFEVQLNMVRENIPVVVSAPEGKMYLTKDALEDAMRRSSEQVYEQEELDQKYTDLDKLVKDTEAAESELNIILSEYQIFAACEFSKWVNKFKDNGLDIKTTLNADLKNEMTVEQRVEAIKQILDAGRALIKEVALVAQPVYDIIRPLYDPTLPEKCRPAEFALSKVNSKEAPWIGVEALYSALMNWKRVYGAEILSSMKYLRASLAPIASLGVKGEVLPIVFGEKYPQVLEYVKKAELMRDSAEKTFDKSELNILDVVLLKDEVASFLGITSDVLLTLYTGLISEGEAIDRLIPTPDYVVEKNEPLRERLRKATATLLEPSKYKINEIMENMPTYLSYVDEAVQTLAVYSERKEFLLNYPKAEAVITERLKETNVLTAKDLPFQPKFAGEYLKLYYTQRFSEFAFDKDNLVLTKITQPET